MKTYLRACAFTLLEVIVAMAIILVVLPGAFALIHSAHRQLLTANRRLQAVYEANAILQQLRYFVSADSQDPASTLTGSLTVFEYGANDKLPSPIRPKPQNADVIGLSLYPSTMSQANYYYTVKNVASWNCYSVNATVNFQDL
jgi:prepilin-type N-terminal cleavage/methylation domain-containing protein